MTDFRALCAELHAAVQLYTGQNPAAAGIPANELVARLMDAMANTAAALAQPEPQGPMAWMYRGEPYFDGERWRENWKVTLDEKVARFNSGNKEPVPLWGRPAIEPVAPTDEEIDDWHGRCADLTRVGEADHYWAFDLRHDEVADVVRAALARWGRPAIEPVPKREDVHYAWELHDAEGEWQAGGSANSLEDVQREGNRYLQTYSQDGPHKLIIERHCVTTIEPVPKREAEQ